MLLHKHNLESDVKQIASIPNEEGKLENNIWTCWYCSEYIYLDEESCNCEGHTMCINCLCSCVQCGKYNEKKYIGFLNGSKVKRHHCDNCHNYPHVTPIDITKSIDWIKHSKQNFNKVEKDISHQGPIITSNWLTDKICVGGYPKTRFELERLIKEGINVFICLNGSDKSEFYKYECQLTSGKTYINEPIEDLNITTDEKIRELCERIVIRIRNGDKVYIHCTGGHGRTGTVAAVVLYMLYKLPIQQIYDYLQFSHDQRVGNYFGTGCYWTKKMDEIEPQKQCFALGQVPTPQVSCQRRQVERIITKLL
jgi:protein-tyrosine phosphatase